MAFFRIVGGWLLAALIVGYTLAAIQNEYGSIGWVVLAVYAAIPCALIHLLGKVLSSPR